MRAKPPRAPSPAREPPSARPAPALPGPRAAPPLAPTLARSLCRPPSCCSCRAFSKFKRWPGFVEFDHVNGKVLTYSAADKVRRAARAAVRRARARVPSPGNSNARFPPLLLPATFPERGLDDLSHSRAAR